MLATSLISVWLAIAPQGRMAYTGPAQPTPAVLEISARLIQGDGQAIAGASKSGAGTFDGYVWSDSSCGLASGDREASRTPAVGWKFSAHVTSQSNEMLMVEIDWQRMWDNQKRVADGPSGKISRAIRMGDRVEIDRFDPGTALKSCGAAAVQLEASAMRAEAPAAMARGGRGGRGAGVAVAAAAGRGAMRGGAGFGAGAGAGAGAGSVAGQQGQQGAQGQQGQGQQAQGQGQQAQQGQRGQQGQLAGQGQQGVPGQRGAVQQYSVQADPSRNGFLITPGQAGARGGTLGAMGGGRGGRGAAGAFGAELWLVHTVSGSSGTDPVASYAARGGRGGRGAASNVNSDPGTTVEREVAHQTLRFAASGSGFAFPAMSIATSRGTVGIIVTGTLNAKVDSGAPTTLVVTVNRQAISPDGSVSTSGGSSTKEIPWPANGDVISFELPAATGAGQDPSAQEKLSIRLRLDPAVSYMLGGRGSGRGGGVPRRR